jgi:hypothetical protein
MDLRRTDLDGLTALAALWKTTPEAEFEAILTNMDLTSWQDVIQYLRSLGMRENPQIVKLNICLTNNIRITLEGAGVIQAYCRDNRLTGKPFTAMLKEDIADAAPVEFGLYSARAKLKREIPLAADDARVKEAISRWDQLSKLYRQIQRFEFVAPGGLPLRFDVSVVRETRGRTYQEARITTAPTRYEAEVELTARRDAMEPAAVTKVMLRGLSWLLQGRQRSYVLVSNNGTRAVLDAVSEIFGTRGAGAAAAAAGGNGRNFRNARNGGPHAQFRYPGPQPATLERRNMTDEIDPSTPNIRTGYNVTDKADGLRCLLYVADNGKIFLVDGGGRVYATGKQTEREFAGTVLDGEWIRRNRKGEAVSHFYAFDIMAAKGGDTGVAELPFMVAGAMLGAAAATNTRQTVMASAVGAMSSAKQTVAGVPATHDLQIGMKSFRAAAAGADIFRDCAAATLEDAKSAPYNTDGLIFTPNAAALPLGRGTWAAQLKWKPPHENTIDFLVIVDKDKSGAVDAIGTKYREDSGQTVRYKTLRLFVGSNRDGAFSDPRTTVLSGEPLPMNLEKGDWREVEFRPTEPRDPMASVCYVPIDAGVADPAGATAAATALDTDSDVIRCTRTGDIIQSDMIVEMAYHPERAPGWRWEPTRIRHDKTERWLTGRKSGTMNADWVAGAIWSSLHNPVTQDAIATGRITECVAPAATVAPATYYSRRAPARDLMKVQCLRNFHNDYIKRNMLLRPTLRAGAALCDLAMGKAGDLHKWIAANVGSVFGCDIAAGNLNDPEDGAYRRLLDKMIAMGGRDRVPPMLFVQADAARRLSTGEAGITPADQELLRAEFGAAGRGAAGYDVVSCMFALHYMFRDRDTLSGFLTNLADTVKVGGYFVGCGFDGDAVARMLVGGENSVIGRDGSTDVWMITKRYGSGIGSSVPPSDMGLGLAVDVDFISIGETHTEYLVSWAYLQDQMATAGLELLTPSECAELGVPAASQMFGDSWSIAEAAGQAYAMSDAVRRYSFLNRWYIFKRRSDRRPAPPAAAPAPPVGLTEVRPEAAEAPPQLDIIELPEEVGAGAGAAAAAEPVAALPPPGPYIVNMPGFSLDERLGAALADWKNYMALGTPVEITDLADPSIKYPSVEAAIAAAKYQRTTDKPALGASLFRVEGAIYQKYLPEITAAERWSEAYYSAIDRLVVAIRTAATPKKMESYRAIPKKEEWNKAAWDAQKADVYQGYLMQRFRVDERFREMVQAIQRAGGEILFANGTESTELGVGIRVDGSVAGGENKVGKWIQELH